MWKCGSHGVGKGRQLSPYPKRSVVFDAGPKLSKPSEIYILERPFQSYDFQYHSHNSQTTIFCIVACIHDGGEGIFEVD